MNSIIINIQFLNYTKWDNLLGVISKAKIACEISGVAIDYRFPDIGKTIEIKSYHFPSVGKMVSQSSFLLQKLDIVT